MIIESIKVYSEHQNPFLEHVQTRHEDIGAKRKSRQGGEQ